MIDLWFPTAIFVEENALNSEDNAALENTILNLEKQIPDGGSNWHTNISNSCGTYDLLSDKSFSNITKLVTRKVNDFAKELGSDYSYQPNSGWYNVYRAGDYQEYHIHTNSIFSAVYYVTNPEKSGRIIFENPAEPDILPLNNVTNNMYNFKNCHYLPSPGTIIIFRSYLRHMVEKCLNTDPRITIAFNFS